MGYTYKMAYSEEVTEGYNMKIESTEGSHNFINVEAPNASRMLGDIKGSKVLDLGCGSGRFTRWLKTTKLAEEVVGVDMSEYMVEHAKNIENKEPLGIFYHAADVSKPIDVDLGTFDLIYAGYLLHYATNKEMLRDFLENIYNLLKDGGVFVTRNQNPDDEKNHPEMLKYGITKMFQRLPPQEGDSIKLKLYSDGKFLCEFDNYYFSRKTYEEVFKDAGFKDFSCEPDQIENEDVKWDVWKQQTLYSWMKAHK